MVTDEDIRKQEELVQQVRKRLEEALMADMLAHVEELARDGEAPLDKACTEDDDEEDEEEGGRGARPGPRDGARLGQVLRGHGGSLESGPGSGHCLMNTDVVGMAGAISPEEPRRPRPVESLKPALPVLSRGPAESPCCPLEPPADAALGPT